MPQSGCLKSVKDWESEQRRRKKIFLPVVVSYNLAAAGEETEDGKIEVPSYDPASGKRQSLAPAQGFCFITL